jgi:photosystem II stability/assembly factor-like uncharacterized protein
MKIYSAILIFCALLFSNCKKAEPSPEPTPVTVSFDPLIRKTPYENSDFRLERVETDLPEGVAKIHFFDAKNAIYLSLKGTFFTTSDGGLNWSQSKFFEKTPNYTPTFDFEVIDNQIVVGFFTESFTQNFTTSFTNEIVRSTDRGKTWTSQMVKDTELKSIVFGTDNYLYVFGKYANDVFTGSITHQTLLTSQDAGLTWKKSVINTWFAPVSNFYFLSYF